MLRLRRTADSQRGVVPLEVGRLQPLEPDPGDRRLEDMALDDVLVCVVGSEAPGRAA